jgi:hypothetical protein
MVAQFAGGEEGARMDISQNEPLRGRDCRCLAISMV